ncbi:hypothetical protein FGO68_gene2519 [Halteria grandinella]|uniref:Complex 1 LYR protein n=1 Tax=Halteria grandinella TaxID=5974 RepID=A0A8J8NHH1_HALGN|nr:hypothetical protein FGO68_gene2519 [Halteria grandinella]
MNPLITHLPYKKTLGMYRRMLKSMMLVFKGDPEMFHRCRLQIRSSIASQADERDIAKVNEYLFQYEETRRILLQNVVQGMEQPDGQYRWKVRKEHAMGASIKE